MCIANLLNWLQFMGVNSGQRIHFLLMYCNWGSFALQISVSELWPKHCQFDPRSVRNGWIREMIECSLMSTIYYARGALDKYCCTLHCPLILTQSMICTKQRPWHTCAVRHLSLDCLASVDLFDVFLHMRTSLVYFCQDNHLGDLCRTSNISNVYKLNAERSLWYKQKLRI